MSVRQGSLRRSLSELRTTHAQVVVELSKRTVAQTVQSTLSEIQSQLSAMQSLADLVAEGEVTGERLEAAQEELEVRMARIDEITSQTRYGGRRLLAGETVRVTTNALTDEGFDVSYPELSAGGLGLSEIDVVNQASEGEAAEIVAEASVVVSSIAEDVGRILSGTEDYVEVRVGELQDRFAAMRSHELLGVEPGAQWRSGGAGPSLPSVQSIEVALQSMRLDAEVVTSLLA
jgi:hypothetical protein